MQLKKKYYIGADHIAKEAVDDGVLKNGYDTIGEATAAAERMVEAGNRAAIVVQVVRVAKRKRPPVVVEDVE